MSSRLPVVDPARPASGRRSGRAVSRPCAVPFRRAPRPAGRLGLRLAVAAGLVLAPGRANTLLTIASAVGPVRRQERVGQVAGPADDDAARVGEFAESLDAVVPAGAALPDAAEAEGRQGALQRRRR